MAFKFKAKEILGATGTFSERLTVSGVSVLTGININTGSFVTTGQTGSFLTTSSNVVYATGNQTISGIKTFSNQTNVSGIKFNILSGSAIPPTFQEGFTWYDDDSKSLSYYNDDQIQVRVGQEQLVRGTNSLSTTLTKGQVVYITGAGGLDKFPGFQLSIASTEMGSARTIGVVANDIGVNEKGYVISFGRLEGIDTTAYNVGDTLYLSSAVSGGFTGVKPQAPIHMVRVGTVLKQGNSANGVIFVTVQNGFELDELHDVRITNPQNSEAILWNSTSGVWTNRQINTGDISGASNFITTSQTGVFVTTGQTGAFASAANLASTGSNLQTQITSLSGTLTDNYVTINTNQTIIANKTFSAQSFIVKDSPSETNVFDFVADDYFYLRSFGGIAEIGFNSPVGSYVTGFQNIYATNIYENGYSVITTNDTGRFNTLNVTGLDLSGKIFISGINGTTVTTNGQTILISSSGGSSSPSSSGTTLPIIFKTVNLTSGLDNSFIQFPSNFGSVPTVLANIINDIGDPFLGFNISGISISGFNLSTSTQIPNNNYKLSYLATTGDGFLTVGTTTGALYGQNVGAGSGIFSGTDGNFLNFKTLVPGNGITISGNAANNSLTISSTGSSSSAISNFSKGGGMYSVDGIPPGNYVFPVWRAHDNCTITGIHGYRIGGTSATVNVTKNNVRLFGSHLSLSSTGSWISSSLISSGVVKGDDIEIEIVTVSGFPTGISIQVDFSP